MFLILIYLKNSTFSSAKTTVDTLIDVRNETSKHHFLKSVTVIYAHFIQNSNQMASVVDRNHKFSEGIFSTPEIFKATSKFFGSQGCSHDKN